MKDTDKVTLTLGQIKRLINESKSNKISPYWETETFKKLSETEKIVWDIINTTLEWNEYDDLERLADEQGVDIDDVEDIADWIYSKFYESDWFFNEYCENGYAGGKDELKKELEKVDHELYKLIKSFLMTKFDKFNIDYEKINKARQQLEDTIKNITYQFGDFVDLVSSEIGKNLERDSEKYENIIKDAANKAIDAVSNFAYVAGAIED